MPVSSEDLNCEDVPGTDFRVIGDDPHRLDEGGVPGIACESDRGGGGSTDTGASVSGNELALTGSETTAAYIALALLMAGVVAGLAGAVAPPERLRGGFTVRTTDRYGQSVAYRVSRRRTRRS